MKPEQQQIAIAEACGWMQGTIERYAGRPDKLVNERWAWTSPPGWLASDSPFAKAYRSDRESSILAPPNYLTDLNAMHEAEKSLVTVGEWISYMENLASVATIPTNGATAWELVCKVSRSDQKGVLYGLAGFVRATASQRAEAFLRTLNLWTES